MGFGGKIYDGVRLFATECFLHELGVGNVAVNKAISAWGARPFLVGEILRIASVGEQIEIDDAVLWALAQDEFDELTSDKTATAGYQQCFQSYPRVSDSAAKYFHHRGTEFAEF
jgi:hypothetical protein